MANVINSLKLGDGTYVFTTPYATCDTVAAEAAKVATTTPGSNFSLETGARITVKFTVTNTAANPTLNVNSTGAKAIYYRGSAISAGYLAANRTYEFVYNGTQYDFIGDIDTDTNTNTSNFVTIGDAQTITGTKTFTETPKFNRGIAVGSTNAFKVQGGIYNISLPAKSGTVALTSDIPSGGGGGDVTAAGNNFFSGENTFTKRVIFSSLTDSADFIGKPSFKAGIEIIAGAAVTSGNKRFNLPNKSGVFAIADDLPVANPTAEGTVTLTKLKIGDTVYNLPSGGDVTADEIAALKSEIGKTVDACCDKELINYNLLKLSEVSYSSRLQDNVEGIISSTVNNAVTGWIPVEYGKNYCGTVLIDGRRQYRLFSYQRMNLKLSDGTIVVYNKSLVPTTADGSYVIRIEHKNAVAMMLHFSVTDTSGNMLDISTSAKLAVYEPMIVEGKGTIDTQTKATTYEYIDGDATPRYKYTLKHDDTKVDKVPVSPYCRSVNFGVLPFGYYKGVADSYEEIFGQLTKYATFIESWKSLVANHSGYVTETALGSASDGQMIYSYDFKPVRIENQDKPIPKIIIVAGQHGFEKSNIYGLYYFVSNLLNKWTQHPSLEYIRNNVELMVIPVLNTYGFDNLEYKNANGVNTNRNYDSNWKSVSDTTSDQYGGATAFDQPETQIVRDLLASNPDALLVIDFHTCGGVSVTDYKDINWCGLCSNTDPYYKRMRDVIAQHLSVISSHFNLDYELGVPNTMMGHMTTTDGTGLLRNWATDNNTIGVLIEGFNGFPNDSMYVGKVYKANEEIIVNWLITAMNYLSK